MQLKRNQERRGSLTRLRLPPHDLVVVYRTTELRVPLTEAGPPND